MKVTISDVAKEAGVSKATVSRVLSNHPAISDETKKRVKQVIEVLGYRPNQVARNLAKNKTRTLGVIFPIDASDSFENPIYIQMMQGISQYAQENQYYLMYAFGKGEEEEKHIKEFATNGVVDGIIILKSEVNDKLIKYLRQSQFPFVVIGRPGRETTVLWVDNDNFGITFEITEDLIEKGYKRIGFVGAKPKWTVSKDRLEGYYRALEVHNIEQEPSLIYYGETFSEKVGREAVDALWQEGTPDAIIATDDLMALGLQSELAKRGIASLPIIGFNNTMLGHYQDPQLSSVEICGEQLGSEAAKLLIDCVEKRIEDGEHSIVETKCIYRGLLKKRENNI